MDGDLSVNFSDGAALMVSAERESLAILLRNALINAFRYATPGSEVSIELGVAKKGVCLQLSNDCEPISPHHFDQLRQRFYRLPGSAGIGAGLGLSIVQRVADRHGIALNLSPREGRRGFSLSLLFAAA